MKPETREKIKSFIIQFAKDKLGPSLEMDVETLRKAYPFHSLFFGDEGIRAFKVQRSLVTSMGKTLIPKLAKLIGEDKYSFVKRNYKISGYIDIGMEEKIGSIMQDLYSGKRKPNSDCEWSEILSGKKNETREIIVVADLYIGDHDDGPLFIEIKSPLPNKDVCYKSKHKMLLYKAIMYLKGINNAQAYLGLWYNPYLTEERYSRKHPYTELIMDIRKEVLLGQGFWDKIGGPGTYNELLELLWEIRDMMKKEFF